jgi:nitrate/nitrite-specific signal transduction histidine kinase
MIVRDDGRGIDTKILESGRIGHWRIMGMRERAESIRAELKIGNQSGVGTEVDLWIPERIAFAQNRDHSLRHRIQRLLSGRKAT